MFVTLSAAGLLFGVQGMLAPELDCDSLLNPGQRAKDFSVKLAFRLASGTELESSEDGAQSGVGVRQESPQEVADKLAWVLGERGFGYRQEGTKITVFDFQGDRITGIRVWCKGRKDEREFVPPLAFRWVLSAPPTYTWATLGPTPRGGPPLARVASGLFAGAVAAVAAPEIDFAALPKDCKEPRMLDLWVCPRMAASGVKAYIAFPSRLGGLPHPSPWTPYEVSQSAVGALKGWDNDWFGFELRQVGLRVGLLRYRTVTDTGETIYDPVVGLAVRSNGPVPALRWTWRPGVRDQFRGIRRK